MGHNRDEPQSEGVNAIHDLKLFVRIEARIGAKLRDFKVELSRALAGFYVAAGIEKQLQATEGFLMP